MAQTGYTPISIYYSATATNTPTAGNLVAGELAINTADGKLFYKDSAGVVQVIGTKGGVGSSTTTQVLYNSSGLVVGSANMTFSGTALTLANDASISGITVGKGTNGVAGNTAVGSSALAGSNSGGGENTAIGLEALNANTTGADQVGVGYRALAANTTGTENVSIGSAALRNSTTGNYNVAVGRSALNQNTTASNNTAVGYQAGYSNNANASGAFFGYQAGYSSTGDNNTFIGAFAGYSVTGAKNTILGRYNGNMNGLDIRTASNYIVLSDGDGNPRVTVDNSGSVYILGTSNAINTNGGFYIAGATNTFSVTSHVTGSASGSPYSYFFYNNSVIGSITQTGTTAVLYNTTSDYRLKTNATPIQNALATVEALNPVSFTWIDGRPDDGFLAHEIQAVIPNCVTGEKDAIDEDGNPIYQQMDNSGVIPFLVKAIQELKAEFDAYKATHP